MPTVPPFPPLQCCGTRPPLVIILYIPWRGGLLGVVWAGAGSLGFIMGSVRFPWVLPWVPNWDPGFSLGSEAGCVGLRSGVRWASGFLGGPRTGVPWVPKRGALGRFGPTICPRLTTRGVDR